MAVTEKFDLVVRARDEASSVLKGIGGNIIGITTAAAGLVAIGAFLKSSISAAIESEKAWNKLGNAVEKHGGIWTMVRERYQSFATALQNQTGISDEAIAESMQLFIDYGANGQQAMDRVRIAADLAAGASIDLSTATTILAKASLGATEILGRYGIKVDENLPKAEKFAAALELISERFGGRAVENAKTLSGQLEILSQKYDDLKESIGGILVGPLTKLVENLNDQLTVWTSNVSLWDKIFSGAEKYAEIANKLRIEQMGLMSAHGSAFDPKSSPIVQTAAELAATLKKAREDADIINRTLRGPQTPLEQGNYRGTGYDTSQRGPGYFGVGQDQVDKAKKDADTARRHLLEIPEAEERALQAAQDKWMEFSGVVLSSTDQLAGGITDMFFGLKVSLEDIFKDMARGWIRYFLNEILKQTALKLGFALFNAVFPGSGSILSAGTAIGSAEGALPGVLGRANSGVDVIGAGANRFASPSRTGPASVTINIQGDIIGEQQYVQSKIIPAIERAAAWQATRIQVA